MSKYITSDPNILSGMPVITGTRVPVARILSLLKEGYTLEEIHKQFDHININTLEDVWADYDADKVGTALVQSAGTLAGVNRKNLLTDMRNERSQENTHRPF
jgi:uncharacterized protein (DUF433 family)